MLSTLYDILEFMLLWECWHVLVLNVLTELRSFISYFYNVMLFHSYLYISIMVLFWFSKWSIPGELPLFQSWPTMSLSVHLPWAGCICAWSGSCIYLSHHHHFCYGCLDSHLGDHWLDSLCIYHFRLILYFVLYFCFYWCDFVCLFETFTPDTI